MARPMCSCLRPRADFRGAQRLLDGVQNWLLVRRVNELIRVLARSLPLGHVHALTRYNLNEMRWP